MSLLAPILSLSRHFKSQERINKETSDLQQQELAIWQSKGGVDAPVPHIIKQRTIQAYQKASQIKVLVETGTYLGDMLEAQKSYFQLLISIELSHKLHRRALKRFKGETKIQLLQGDSGKVLHQVMQQLKEPAIFWLDGHYSAGMTAKGDKECPIFEELDAIFSAPQSMKHILLIDDARCFVGANDYPTIDKLKAYFKQHQLPYQIEVQQDIIRCTPL